MSIIKVVLVLCLTSVSKQIEAQKANPLECPRDTIAYGMTVSIPELDYWRDPKFGPPPANNAPMPLSVCLLCHTITTILGNREDGENVETLQENQPSYQVCIGKGDLSRTISQTFDCYENSYLKYFNKPHLALNSTYGCSKPNPNVTVLDTYQTSFSNIATNSRSRANWRDMATNMSCGGDTFICGLEIYMDGKLEETRESSLSFEEFTVTESTNGQATAIQFEEENSEVDFEGGGDIVRTQRGPEFVPKCCSIRNEKSSSSQERYTVSNKELMQNCYNNAPPSTIIALAVLVAILTLALFICCANLFCCPCVKQSISQGDRRERKIMDGSGEDYADPEISPESRRESVFGSRPPTVGGGGKHKSSISILPIPNERD